MSVGAKQKKISGDRFLRGTARFVDDVKLPSMLYAAILRSPYPHARILRIDTETAGRREGVVRVLGGEEAAELSGPIPHFIDPSVFGGNHAEVRCLAIDRVLYAGQPVAAVVAKSPQDSEAALRDISVEYEELPAVLEAAEAVAPEAPTLNAGWDSNVLAEDRIESGDVESGLSGAALVVGTEVSIQRYTTSPIEPRGYAASWDELEEKLTFYGSCQNPHPLRWSLAQALRLPEYRVRVVAPDVGGAFGLKMHGHPEETLVAVLSRLLGRPVKWIENRSECFLIGGREQTHRLEVGFSERGEIVALRDHILANVGAASATLGWAMTRLTAVSLLNGYRVSDIDIGYQAVVTNKAPWNASRGYGKEAAILAIERVMNIAASRLGLAEDVIRRRNFVAKDSFPYATPTGLDLDSGDYEGVLDKCMALVDYGGWRKEQVRLREEGRQVGVGLAFEVVPEAGGIRGTFVGDYETATVKMTPQGEVTVLTGVTSPGGGNETGIAQIVAQDLGCRIEDIRVIQGDTDLCPYGFGNFSGRGTLIGGSAAALAARDVGSRLRRAAASLLEVLEEEVTLRDGEAVAKSGERLALSEVAMAIYTQVFEDESGSAPLEATRSYKPGRPGAQRTHTYPSYSNGVYAAVVEVDVETGVCKILDLAAVDDCGTIINPALVEGQIQGGFAMGLGGALYEELKYNSDGRLATDAFKTYLLPRANDIPKISIGHQVTPSPNTLLGVKGAGESGMGGGLAAVANAVADALLPWGVEITHFPLSPPRILQLLENADD